MNAPVIRISLGKFDANIAAAVEARLQASRASLESGEVVPIHPHPITTGAPDRGEASSRQYTVPRKIEEEGRCEIALPPISTVLSTGLSPERWTGGQRNGPRYTPFHEGRASVVI